MFTTPVGILPGPRSGKRGVVTGRTRLPHIQRPYRDKLARVSLDRDGEPARVPAVPLHSLELSSKPGSAFTTAWTFRPHRPACLRCPAAGADDVHRVATWESVGGATSPRILIRRRCFLRQAQGCYDPNASEIMGRLWVQLLT